MAEMNYPQFSLVEETPNAFVVAHPETGAQVPIAKTSLDDKHQEEIRGLPKFAQLAMNTIVPGSAVIGNMIAKENQQDAILPPPVQPIEAPAQVAVPQQPMVAQPVQQMPQPIQQPVASGFDMQTKGLKQMADHQAAAELEKAAINQAFQQQLADTQKVYADKRLELDNNQAQLEKDFKNGTIDPNHFWNQQTGVKGGLNRVLSMVGLFLGGMGTIKGTGNPAQQMLDRAIQNDIDAQKENLGKQKSLLNLNMQKYGDLRTAESATKLDMLNMFNLQLQEMAAKTNSKVVNDQFLINAGQIQLQKDALKDQISKQVSMQNLQNQLAQGAQLTDTDIQQLPKELKETAVKVYDPINGTFSWAQAKSPANVKEVDEISTTVKNIVDTIDAMKAARAKYKESNITGSVSVLPGTDKANQYSQLHKTAVEDLRSLSKTARMGEGTTNYLSEIIPKPGSVFTSDEEMERAKNIIINKLNNEIQNRVFNAKNLNPLQAQSREKPL